jgi:hypothetical protein
MSQENSVNDLLKTRPVVINFGIEELVKDFEALGVEFAQVDWKPPAQGNLNVLRKMWMLTNKKGGGYGYSNCESRDL